MKGIEVPFADVGKVSVEVIYGAAKKLFQQSGGADCLYLLGVGWDCLTVTAGCSKNCRRKKRWRMKVKR